MATILSPEQFIHEIKQWGTDEDTLHKVRVMKKNNHLYFRFYIPQTTEIIETRILEDKFDEFDFLELGSAAVPAIWDDGQLKKIDSLLKKLEESNAGTITSAFNQRPHIRA